MFEVADARSFLYVPGDRTDRFRSAADSEADVVIVDLEDAVALPDKVSARRATAAFLMSSSALVRINAGERGGPDVEELRTCPGLLGFVVPKASAAAVASVGAAAPGIPLVPLIESGVGVVEVADVARCAGVVRLAVGEVDLAGDLRLGPDPHEGVLWAVRAAVVAASAASGVAAPIGPVQVTVDDGDLLERSTRELRAAGFLARQVIHPRQVGPVHRALRPSDDEVADASRLLAAAAAHGGVFVDGGGRMVDEAVLRSARLTLALAR